MSSPESNNNKSELMSGLPPEVQLQLLNLGLKPETVTGKILDVGAEDGAFAKAFKDKEATEITSIDTDVTEENKASVIEADARKLPFEDSTYDRVISHASMPHIFISLYSFDHPEESEQKIYVAVSEALREMLRVLKPGKEARMAPVSIADDYPSQRAVAQSIKKVLADLEEEGVPIKFQYIQTVINDKNGEITKQYRIIMTKPKEPKNK